MILPGTLFAREKLAPADVPQFLKNFNSNFSMLDSLYREVSEDQLPLRDEYGKLLGRRPIEDRRQALSELRQNALRLAADPEDLIQTSTLIFKTENLADDLYDLAQIAYDNGLEDLGKRLSDFQITMDHNKDLLGDYLLALAAQKQDHLARLENEKSELEAKIRDAEKQKK